MIFVIFEVAIKEDFMDNYLAMASELKDCLASAKGFIRSERFSSIVNERKLLSLSVWENEEAVNEWRNQNEHRKRQQRGRDSVSDSYTITVATALRSYTDKERKEAPADSNALFAHGQ